MSHYDKLMIKFLEREDTKFENYEPMPSKYKKTPSGLAMAVSLLPVPENIFYFMKDSKRRKISYFFLENWVSLFISIQLFFFSLNKTKKKLYANVPEIFNFNPKTSIRKYPIFWSWYNFFSANVSDFYAYFSAKN